jgi:hypothetical protein
VSMSVEAARLNTDSSISTEKGPKIIVPTYKRRDYTTEYLKVKVKLSLCLTKYHVTKTH